MQQHDASVCLLTSRANVTYFTGFVPRNNEHLHCASLVTHDDVITLTAADVTELSVWAASGVYVDGRATSAYMREYFASVGSVLASFRERIAVDCDVRSRRFLTSVRQEAEGEKKQSGSDRVRNVAAQIMRMRRTRSGHEVEVLRHAVHSSHVGAEAALVAIKEGVGEFKVTMHASKAMVRSIAQFFPRCDVSDSKCKTSHVTWLDTSFNIYIMFVYFSAWVWLQNSLKEDSRKNILSHRKIEKEDSLLLRCCPIIEGLVLIVQFVVGMTSHARSCLAGALDCWGAVCLWVSRQTSRCASGKRI